MTLRHDLIQAIFPPVALCFFIVLLVFAICMKRRQLCVKCLRNDAMITPNDVTSSANLNTAHVIIDHPVPYGASSNILIRPSLTMGQTTLPIHPPTYTECIPGDATIRSFTNVCEIPPSYEDLFGYATPYPGELALNIDSLSNADVISMDTVSRSSDHVTSRDNITETAVSVIQRNVTPQIAFTVTVNSPHDSNTHAHAYSASHGASSDATMVSGGHSNPTFIYNEF